MKIFNARGALLGGLILASGYASGARISEGVWAHPIEQILSGRCVVSDLNDQGVVIGTIYWRDQLGSDHQSAFRTGANGTGATFIWSLSENSQALSINELGHILARYTDASGQNVTFVAFPNGETQRLNLPSGASAVEINDRGQVAGTLYRGLQQNLLFIGETDGNEIRVIPTPGTGVSVAGLTNKGQIVGRLDYPGGTENDVESRPFVTSPHGSRVTVLKFPASWARTDVSGVNELGQITGTAWDLERQIREQFVADGNTGKVRSLGTLFNRPGGISEAGDINDLGYAVGVSSKGEKFNYIPVTITDPKGVMRDLNRMIVNLPEGVSLSWYPVINNRNQVAAGGTDGRCYLVCATPDCSE